MGDQPQQNAAGALWAELIRRRVIRVVVMYAVAGWIVIEIASTGLPNLGLPDWTVKLVTILVMLGFVLAIMLAWAFDIGPGGVHRTTNTDSAVSVEAKDKVRQSPTVIDERKSIAVLPFVNLSGDIENE